MQPLFLLLLVSGASAAVLGALVGLGVGRLVGRRYTEALPWMPAALEAVTPEPSPIIQYLAAVNDLTMAVREAWNASQGRRVSEGGLERTLNAEELLALCDTMAERGRALQAYLAPLRALKNGLRRPSLALDDAWTSRHELRTPEGHWHDFRPALARVATTSAGRSRHTWMIDQPKAVNALNEMVELTALEAFELAEVRDYRVQYELIDPAERALIERLWSDAAQPFVNHWLDSTDLDEEIVSTVRFVRGLHGRLVELRDAVAEADDRFVLDIAGMIPDEPELLVLSKDMIERIVEFKPGRLPRIDRRLVAAQGLARSIREALTHDDRLVLRDAVQLHRLVFPHAPKPFLRTGSRGPAIVIGVAAGSIATAAAWPLVALLIQAAVGF